jgi:hypothetical protein
MENNRIFTDEELKTLAMPLVNRIEAAIDNGRYEEAKSLARQMEDEYRPIVFNFEEFTAILLSHIYQQYGDDALEEALRYAASVFMKPMHEALGSLSIRELAELFAGVFRSHSGRGLKIEEDDEKITFILDPCESGGRMVKDGFFGPPRNLLRVKKSQPITFGRENFPSYCCHCAIFHHLEPIERSGAPFPPIDIGKGPGDPCKWHFYKDAKRISARFYEQVGKKKP